MLMHAEVVYSGVNMVHLDGKEAIAPKVARTQLRPKMAGLHVACIRTLRTRKVGAN